MINPYRILINNIQYVQVCIFNAAAIQEDDFEPFCAARCHDVLNNQTLYILTRFCNLSEVQSDLKNEFRYIILGQAIIIYTQTRYKAFVSEVSLTEICLRI